MGQQRGAVARMAWHGGAAVGAAVGTSVVAWAVLPADVRVPIHIGVDGVDRWTGKLEAVLAVPAGMLYVLLVGLVVTARGTRRGREEPLAFVTVVGSLWFLTVLHAALLASPLGSWGPGVLVTVTAVGVALGVVARRRAASRPAAHHSAASRRAANRRAASHRAVSPGDARRSGTSRSDARGELPSPDP